MNSIPATNGLPVGLGLSIGQEQSTPSVTPLIEGGSTSSKILEIIQEYALNKFDDSESRQASGAARFLSTINYFIMTESRLEMCLPAFPFKSANKVYKVLGALPDKAEELALERLNTLCTRIKAIYKPGARITIISDGTTYNGNPTATCLKEFQVLTASLRSIVNFGSRYMGLWRDSA